MMNGPCGCFLRAMTAREPGAWASLPEQIKGLSSWAAATLVWPVIPHRWSANSEGGRTQAGEVCEWGMDPPTDPKHPPVPALNSVLEAERWARLRKHRQQPPVAPPPLSTIRDCLRALLPLPSDCELLQAHHLQHSTCYGMPHPCLLSLLH